MEKELVRGEEEVLFFWFILLSRSQKYQCSVEKSDKWKISFSVLFLLNIFPLQGNTKRFISAKKERK